MQQLEINIGAAQAETYKIWVGSGLISKVPEFFDLSSYSRVAVLSDHNVAPHWGATLVEALSHRAELIVIPAGEEAKNITTVELVWRRLLEAGCDRKSLVLNLGGGVVGDLGGFAAASYMRGVDFVQIPTTLLSQVDASVGGKLGINSAGVKNLAGVFRQPRGVIIDTDTLSTLPKRELLSGLAEVLKHGLIRDADYFTQVCGLGEAVFEPKNLEQIILRSCQIKAEVVQADELEGGLRKILNFGHSIGHAIEILSHARLPAEHLLHGEAVSLGMLAEAKLSELAGFISAADLDHIRAGLQGCGLPVTLKQRFALEDLLAKLKLDKKNVGGVLKWTLLRALGEAVFDVEILPELVEQSLREEFA
ncbi:MAG: 3-dehydroquinate synthase [Deltaproteobacteria bacterium]|nr:3-dehydroquinate synthase [Deltaproteobacteria bacterium]